MKVTPVNSPHAMITPQTSNNSSSRAKAIEMLTKAPAAPTQGQAQEHPVANANNVSVEELSAIQSTQPTQTPEITDKNTPSEAEETAPETPKQDPALTRQFAQLARQERALRAKAQQQDQAIKAREADLIRRESELQAKAPDLTKYIPRERLKEDALSVLDEAGISYDELTQQIIGRQPTDPRVTATIGRLEAKIQELEEANKSSQKTYQDQQQASYQAAVKQIKMDAVALVKADPNFETIKATNSVNDVVELITKTYDKDGILLTVEEAAQEVENYLVEEALKLTQVQKIKARLAQNAQTGKTEQKTQPKAQQTQPMKTLTNATSSSRKLSARERAMLAFKGELKS